MSNQQPQPPDEKPKAKYPALRETMTRTIPTHRVIVEEVHRLIGKLDFLVVLDQLSTEALFEIGTMLKKHVKALDDEDEKHE